MLNRFKLDTAEVSSTKPIQQQLSRCTSVCITSTLTFIWSNFLKKVIQGGLQSGLYRGAVISTPELASTVVVSRNGHKMLYYGNTMYRRVLGVTRLFFKRIENGLICVRRDSPSPDCLFTPAQHWPSQFPRSVQSTLAVIRNMSRDRITRKAETPRENSAVQVTYKNHHSVPK